MRLDRISENGFTLVEVMVALFIVALALPALMFQIGSQVNTVSELRDRTVASWVAQNQLALLELSMLPDNRGQVEMSGRQWLWQMNTEPTAVPGLQRYTVEVTSVQRPADTLSRLVVYQRTALTESP
ncbi:type II secretion system minor pseudopilin GspI [Pseudohongiella spirulinae]|uniref:Type II secretion system protein I n=1 Tax=Pseudohongiella spirulinae TaxID=1249552 RepID=A0A0S2KFX8_9GAMM|nr:type II secretion system minor pseudopilin GspI [Pseudohongiella spirulinae]ALO47027.1 General secretion pathway protein I [Pseudohongiella spirulinae]